MKKKNKTTTEIISLPKISQINDENKQAIQQMTLKLTFLSQENSNLKVKVQDLQGLLKQKEELFKHISFEDAKASAKVSTDLSNKYPRSNINNNNKEAFPNIIEALYGENQKLYEILERVSKERDDADSKVFDYF